jgi:hypothetical protein
MEPRSDEPMPWYLWPAHVVLSFVFGCALMLLALPFLALAPLSPLYHRIYPDRLPRDSDFLCYDDGYEVLRPALKKWRAKYRTLKFSERVGRALKQCWRHERAGRHV